MALAEVVQVNFIDILVKSRGFFLHFFVNNLFFLRIGRRAGFFFRQFPGFLVQPNAAPVQDIFLDDVTGAAANLSYYETLTGYVHSLGGSDVLNPGAPPASGYLSTNVCNGIVVMEDTLAAFESNPPPNYSGSSVQIAYIITSGPSQADLLSTLQAIKSRGGNLVYVSDQGNSYSDLPSYFAAENSYL